MASTLNSLFATKSQPQQQQQQTQQQQQQPKVACHQCHKLFAHKYSLEKHLKTMHGLIPTFNCPECRLEFASRKDAQQHSIQVHGTRKIGGTGLAIIGATGIIGSSSSSSPKKKSKKNGGNPSQMNPFSGGRLQQQFGDPNALKKKKRRTKKEMQAQQTPTIIPPNWKKCTDCFEVFPPNQFYYHMKRVHGHGTRHLCPEPGCGKEFLFPTGLKRHLLHHGEKRFDCNVCQKKFSQLATLRKHLSSQHNIFEIDLNTISNAQQQQTTQKPKKQKKQSKNTSNNSSSVSSSHHNNTTNNQQNNSVHVPQPQHHLSSSTGITTPTPAAQIQLQQQQLHQQQQQHQAQAQAAAAATYHQQQNAHGASWVIIPGISSWPGSSYQTAAGSQGLTLHPSHHHH